MKEIFVKQVRVDSGEIRYVVIKTRNIMVSEDTKIGHILTKEELQYIMEIKGWELEIT